MNLDQANDMVRETLTLMLVLSTPVLAAALVIGLIISVVQAATQIQEQTLSFVPKIMGMAVVTMLAAPWMSRLILEFSSRMFGGAG